MKYGKIKNCDTANGTGVRVSLFVSGCRNHCKGCFQPETWDFNYGEEFTEETKKQLFEYLKPNWIAGLSILGGDPMEPENLQVLTPLCAELKSVMPEKNIWVYTGYLWEQLQGLEILDYIDVLVDGPFIEEQKTLGQFKGSANQRIIKLK